MTPTGPTTHGWHRIEAAFRCLREYQLETVQGIAPREADRHALDVGVLVHAGVAAWKGCPDDKDWPAVVNTAMQAIAPSLRAMTEAVALVEAYVEHWAAMPSPVVLAVEYTLGPCALVPGDPKSLWRSARLDAIERHPEHGSRLWINELKTTSESVAAVVERYTLHGQTLLQTALWEVAPEGKATHGPIAGIMLDVIKKGYGGRAHSFARVPITVPPHAVAWFIADMRAKLAEVAAVTKDTPTVRNPASCFRRGRPCPYRGLCLRGPGGTAGYSLADGTPLAAWKPTKGWRTPPWDL